MTDSGLSAAGLRRMRDAMAGFVERGELPGLVTVLSRRGETHVEAIGTKAVGSADRMHRDTIFRISSMTKPVTAAATMILVEECRLRLDDPVDPLLPELADRRVLRRIDSDLDDTVPATRPITLRDLLTFTFGFGLVMAMPGTYPIQQATDDALLGQGPPDPATPPEPDEWIRRFGTLPLIHQPGEGWMYNTGSDVLGVLIARASGQPFEAFLRDRIFEPLGMTDTGFSVPAEKLGRLATSYWPDPETGGLTLGDDPRDSHWGRPPAFPSGAGGLVSTADDFLAFGAMMLNKGRYAGRRLLSRTSVEAMTTDQLTPSQKGGPGALPGLFDASGWGFGVSVVTRRIGGSAAPGRFGWDGGQGTSWSSDFEEDLVGILLTQRGWSSPIPPPVCADFWTTAYAAIDD